MSKTVPNTGASKNPNGGGKFTYEVTFRNLRRPADVERNKTIRVSAYSVINGLARARNRTRCFGDGEHTQIIIKNLGLSVLAEPEKEGNVNASPFAFEALSHDTQKALIRHVIGQHGWEFDEPNCFLLPPEGDPRRTHCAEWFPCEFVDITVKVPNWIMEEYHGGAA